jgi:hypothetical protein
LYARAANIFRVAIPMAKTRKPSPPGFDFLLALSGNLAPEFALRLILEVDVEIEINACDCPCALAVDFV